MRGEWKRVKLSEIADINMGQSPSSSSYNKKGEGVIFYQGNRDFGYLYPSVSMYTTDPKKIAEKDDILLSVRAPVGELNIANKRCCIGRGLAAIRLKKSHNRFLYYLLKYSINRLHQISSGTTFSSINKTDLKNLEVFVPPLPTQKKIAHILSTLDDKIELNRQMNETLEAMAQAIFKSWFVDFDPIHAKAAAKSEADLDRAAKELGISREILDLFPREFVESEMGRIPKGWEVKPLDKIAHYQNGLALQKYRPKNEKHFLPVLKIAQLKKGYADGEEKADLNIKPECIVNNGDVVFSWSGSLMVDVWCGGKAALNQHLFKVTSKNYPKWFYYYWTKQHLLNFQRIAKDKAVTMGHIKRSHLSEALCVIPDDTIFNMAKKLLNPLIEKLIFNRLEVNSLQRTRDTLLPKLLSGELDISKLEESNVY